MRKCTVSWCDKDARGRFCNGHWSNYRVYGVPNPAILAFTVGKRTLVAKTCTICGTLKMAKEYGKRNAGYYRPHCTNCLRNYNKHHPPKDFTNKNAYQVQYMRTLNASLREHADHHYEHYTVEDWEVILDDDLTIKEKAEKLGRTYRAINNQLYKHRHAVAKEEEAMQDAN